MAGSFSIDDQGDHEYVVHLQAPAETIETWFRLTPEVLDELGLGQEQEETVVRRTVEFLLRHQDAEDFPRMVELEDVLATYPDYPAAVRGE